MSPPTGIPFGEKLGRWAFWLYNGGLVLWIVFNFFPIGWPQLDAVYEHGLAYARSQDFYDTTLFWQWMRLPGDVVFALGALLMAWDFIVKLRPLFPRFVARFISGTRRLPEADRRRAMSSAVSGVAGRGTPVFLTQGFRPFFLAAGLWSAAALALWIVMLATGTALPSRFDPLSWHIHEMLFGFVMAAVAGFLLTAIPNWTKRLPISGFPLALLAGLWLLGRIACLISALMPAWLAVAADLAFPALLAIVVAREIIASKNWRNLPIVVSVTVLGIANLLMHLEADGVAVPTGLGWRLGLAAVIVLISVMAGRIVPSFTRNWLAKRQIENLPAAPGAIDRAALGVLHVGLFGWVFLPEFQPVGVILLLGAALNLWRLLRWCGAATAAEPLLLVLHVGYGWLVLGVALLGLAVIDAHLPQSAAIHALTAGAIGTMTLAVMTRATLGHTGRALVGRSRDDRNLPPGQRLRDHPGRRRRRRDLDDAAACRVGYPVDRRLCVVRPVLWTNAASLRKPGPVALRLSRPARVSHQGVRTPWADIDVVRIGSGIRVWV